MSERIRHDENGPFVLAARGDLTAGQTERVYAFETSIDGNERQWWNTMPVPFESDEVRSFRQFLDRYKPGAMFRVVHRDVTITATEWAEADDA